MDTVLNAVSATADDAALPFESIDDFSTDPVSFGEMAERMLEKVEYVFDLSTIYNRQSEEYLKICAILEKGIKYLASSCITKSALEYEKLDIPMPGQLSLEKLYGMASFNYRKLDTALTEQLQCIGQNFSPELLDMDFSYYHLLLRLRATEQKKYDYFMGVKYEGTGNRLIHTGRAFNSRFTGGPKSEPPVFRRAPAFPVNKGEIIEVQAKQESDEDESLKLSEKNHEVSLKNTKRVHKHTGKKEIRANRVDIPGLPSEIGNLSLKTSNNDPDEFLNESFDTGRDRDHRSGVRDQSGKQREASGRKISDAQLQKEFDDEMKKTWARFTSYIEEERKGRSAPP